AEPFKVSVFWHAEAKKQIDPERSRQRKDKNQSDNQRGNAEKLCDFPHTPNSDLSCDDFISRFTHYLPLVFHLSKFKILPLLYASTQNVLQLDRWFLTISISWLPVGKSCFRAVNKRLP